MRSYSPSGISDFSAQEPFDGSSNVRTGAKPVNMRPHVVPALAARVDYPDFER